MSIERFGHVATETRARHHTFRAVASSAIECTCLVAPGARSGRARSEVARSPPLLRASPGCQGARRCLVRRRVRAERGVPSGSRELGVLAGLEEDHQPAPSGAAPAPPAGHALRGLRSDVQRREPRPLLSDARGRGPTLSSALRRSSRRNQRDDQRGDAVRHAGQEIVVAEISADLETAAMSSEPPFRWNVATAGNRVRR